MLGSTGAIVLGGGAAVGAKVAYGYAEAAMRKARGFVAADYPSTNPLDFIVPAAVGLGVGLAVAFAPTWVGAILAGTLGGALVEATRRRVNFAGA